MNPIAYLNGEIVSDDRMVISARDIGFVQGVTISEQLRTFGGKLFRPENHFQRLSRSLDIIGIDSVDLNRLAAEASTIASHNHSLLQSSDDLGLSLFVTPGIAGGAAAEPTVGMFTAPLPFRTWARKYECGESLVVTGVRQVPESCWPSELKCRSRMHYYLADREAQQRHAGARALLLDQDGFIAEASTASVLVYRQDEGLIAPRPEKVLPSISVRFLESLADELEIRFVHRDLTVDDVHSADEILLSSTSPCLLPVLSVDHQTVSDGQPGAIFQQLISMWSDRVGVDIIDQAQRFSQR